ncbi:MAG: hypothetical protein KGD61_04670 [Candidatus Lokiarchaeota archaeon]|nr:hypothetical protein [Candidatus Lokiarchaeota archaeon]
MFLELWVELMILQTIIGYCFALANEFIGLYNIKDLNRLKGDFETVRFHKRFGWIEISIFYALFIQCMYMLYAHVVAGDPNLFIPSGIWAHTWIGGLIASIMVTFKFIIARFKKDNIYLYGQYIGPIGFFGWSLAHWTSLYNFYFVVLPHWNSLGRVATIVPNSFVWAAVIPFIVGLGLFVFVLYKRGSEMKEKSRFAFNQIAFLLHGVTFGYEKSAKELLGTPALFKFVVPRTYEFIEKMMTMSGLNMRKLEKLSLSDALKEFMKMAEKIGMAEKVKIKWESEKSFTIESVNCSTAQVRSVMTKEELTHAICPWAIFAASIANKITGKELRMEPSEFNEIGALTKLTIID